MGCPTSANSTHDCVAGDALADPALREQLTREGVEVLDNWLGELYRYDLEAHERVPRQDTPFGEYRTWDFQERDTLPQACARP